MMNFTFTRRRDLMITLALGLTATISRAYDLPALPPIPPLPAPQAANSVAMGDAASFPEVKMDFAIETNGPFAPTWSSISQNVSGNGTPAWLRQGKFGIWFHYGPQAQLASGDWSAQHMYQQGATAYNNHLAQYGHPSTNGYKEVINSWDPANYNPAALAQMFYNAGARFVLVQGVHHDNFDNWNSRYNPWNMMNFGAKRDTMLEWSNALHSLNMRMGIAFHHEYSWWFWQPAFLSDSSGAFAGVPYDAVTSTNGAGKWWQNYDPRFLHTPADLHEYSGIATPTTGYWNPGSGIFANHLNYANWFATWWALRILDAAEKYNPDFIYTDGNSTQPFSGFATGTGYKCDAMQRVIAHFYNRALQRRGQLDTLAVVKFHNGDRIGTTFEGNYSSTVKTDQPWFAEFAIGDWFYRNGISYDNGGTIVQRLLEAVSRDGAMMVNIPNKPDGSFDSGVTNMLNGVGQWMNVHGEGIYGSRAWAKPTEGNFRFTVGSNGFLYAFYFGIPSGGTRLTVASLATTSNLLVAPITSVSLLGSGAALTWSQTATGLNVTLPTPMPTLPSGTAIGLKIGPASAVGAAIPTGVIALPGSSHIQLSWFHPSVNATFKVKRSTTQGGPHTTIATGLTNSLFIDTAVSAGTLYFYVVTATDAAGESAPSAEAAASLAGSLSNQWLTLDIGAVGAAGSFALNGGVFTVQGSGGDIWYNADEFRFGFQTLTGDCAITARVLNMQNTAPWAKAGVMIRETLDASSKYVINFLSPANGAALQQRADTGGSATGPGNTTGIAAPYWVRLTRAGDLFTAYLSPDGINWTASGATTVAMNSSVYVGLAVCSVNDGTLCQAQFDNVGFSATSVAISSPLPALIHRYSFNEASGTIAYDSIGGAHGSLVGGAVFDGIGRAVLDGTSGTYVALPGNLLAGLSNVTIEAWVTNAATPDNVALFSFDDGTQTGVGGGYLRYVLHDQSNGRNFLELASGGGNSFTAGRPGLGGRSVHVLCAYNPVAGAALIYTNGVLEATMSTATPLSAVSANSAALGRSPWNGDPWLAGAIDEFRIYAGQLFPEDIAAAQIVGPDVLLTTSVSLGILQGNGTLTLHWPVAGSGFTLESSAALGAGAAWMAVTNSPSVVGTNHQVTLTPLSSTMFFRLRR